MKLKLALLAVFAAGLGASLALADSSPGTKCKQVHLDGTLAPQSLTLTVAKASKSLGLAAGSQAALAVGATGQIVRVNVEACATGTGSAAQIAVRKLELRVEKAKPDHPKKGGTTGTTTTTP